MKRLIFILALTANFILVLAVMSNSLDPDFGWHLSFGRDWAQTGQFPYTDTYTWSKPDMPYTNHEWGGSALLWFIYSRFGYTPLLFIAASTVLAGFLIIQKTFFKKITTVGLVFSFIALWCVTHILVMRLAMVTLFFMALTLYILEKIDTGEDKYIWFLAPLFWLWSCVHGSWVLGFIIINIYFFASLAQKIAPLKLRPYLLGKIWNNKIFYKLIATQAVAVGLIAINPYGLKIFVEISEYFQQGYYKNFIGEWVPSYNFPIFWEILILQTVGLALLARAYWAKQVTIRQGLIYLAFFYSAWSYKRNALLIAPLTVPILAATAEYAWSKLKKIPLFSPSKILKLPMVYFLIALLALNFFYILRFHNSTDIWNDPELLSAHDLPLDAANFLNARLQNEKPKIFNDFNWGGFMIYKMPGVPIYFDGRGTATWMYNTSTSMLAHYHAIFRDPDGLAEIENNDVKYIFLEKHTYFSIGPPDRVNKFLFGSRLNRVYNTEPRELEKDLENNQNWQLIYSNTSTNIWQNVNPALTPPPRQI